MTYTKQIAGLWFTQAQIAKAFDITRKNAESLCDSVTTGKANGGYGMNIVEKEAGQDSQAREQASVRLARVGRGK